MDGKLPLGRAVSRKWMNIYYTHTLLTLPHILVSIISFLRAWFIILRDTDSSYKSLNSHKKLLFSTFFRTIAVYLLSNIFFFYEIPYFQCVNLEYYFYLKSCKFCKWKPSDSRRSFHILCWTTKTNSWKLSIY